MAGVGGGGAPPALLPGIATQKNALLQNFLLSAANRAHLTSTAFANATPVDQQSTLDAFANQVASAAAPAPAPAPALTAAELHQQRVDRAQAAANAARQALGMPQCQMLLFSSFHVY